MNELELLIRARDEATVVLNRLNGTVRTTNRELRNVSGASNGINQAAQGLRRLVAAGVGLAAGAVSLRSFVGNAAAVEQALIAVQRTTDLSAPALENFRGQINQIAQEVPRASTELLGIAAIAGQLGVRGADNLARFAETIARLADSTNIIGEQGALQLAQLINITGDEFANIDRVGAAIAALGNNSATTEAQIVRTSTVIGAALSNFGTSTQDVLGLSAAVASLGQSPQLASSSIGTAIREIVTATAQGGASLERFAELAGQSTEEFTESFTEDNLAGFLDVLEGIGDLDAQETVLTLDELSLSGLGLSRVLPLLADNVDGIRESIRLSNVSYEENLALIRESERAYMSFNAQIRFARNELGVLSALAGTQFLDELAESAQNFTETLRGFIARDAFRSIGDSIARVLRIFNDEGTQTVSTFEIILISVSDVAERLADAAEFMTRLTQGGRDLGVELNPVRALFQGLALTSFTIQNAFRQLPDTLIIFSTRFRRFLLQIRSDINDILSNLPQRFGGAVSAQTRDEADARIAELERIEAEARANLTANQRLANTEGDALIRRLTGLTAAEDMLAQQEQELERQIEASALEAILERRVEAVRSQALSLEDFNAELVETLRQIESGADIIGGATTLTEALIGTNGELMGGEAVALSGDQIRALFDEARNAINDEGEEVQRQAAEAVSAAAQEAAAQVARDLAATEIRVAEGIAAIERQFADGNLSIAAFFQERARLQTEGIDAQIEATRQGGGDNADAEILQLQSERRAVAIETANEIAEAEARLADMLRDVASELQNLNGVEFTLAEETDRVREQYADLIQDLQAEGDESGLALVNNLINTQASQMRFDTLFEQARETQRRIREELQAIDDTPGLTANQRDQARDDVSAAGAEELAAQIPQLQALADTVGNPELLERVDNLRENIQELGTESMESFIIIGDFLQDSLTQQLNGVIQGTQSLSEAFRSFASTAVAEIQRVIVQLLIQRAIQATLNAFAPGAGDAFAAAQGLSLIHI